MRLDRFLTTYVPGCSRRSAQRAVAAGSVRVNGRTARKGQPYESGMNPYGPGIRRMSVRYYLIAVLFILFDVEVIFFFPWAVVFRSLGVPGLVEMIVFIVILEVAFVYAWKKGALEWE